MEQLHDREAVDAKQESGREHGEGAVDAQREERADRSLYDPDRGKETAAGDEVGESDRPTWTEVEKRQAQEECGWSDEIMDAISSREEYEIYRKAGLQEAEIGGRPCLIRGDIDMSQKDGMGRTNRERMGQGLSPLTPEGKKVELHHIGQKADSPLAELTVEEHRGPGNDRILHDKTVDSEIDRNRFNTEKADHWKQRGDDIMKEEDGR